MLRGTAQLWYTGGIDDLAKAGLHLTPGLDLWAQTLTCQFRRPVGESLTLLTRANYLLKDAADRRPFAEYVFAVQRHARNAGMEAPMQQLTYAYAGMDALLKQGFPEPTETTSTQDFIRIIDAQRDTLSEVAKAWLRGGPGCSTRLPPLRERSNYQTTPPRYPTGLRQYPKRSYGDNDVRQPVRVDSNLPRLAITDGRTPVASRPSTERAASGKKSLRPFKTRPVHSAHHIDGSNDEEKDDEDPVAEDIHLVGDRQGDEEQRSDDDDGVVQCHLVMPSTVNRCSICHVTFQSRSKLHRHLKEAEHGVSRG